MARHRSRYHPRPQRSCSRQSQSYQVRPREKLTCTERRRTRCASLSMLAVMNSQCCLVIGYLYRESGVVTGITNKRWAALYPHSLVTCRKDGSKEPSKAVALHRRCQLSTIKAKEFMLRDKHTSTIWALAAGHYERKELVRFHGCTERFAVAQYRSFSFSERSPHLCVALLHSSWS